MRDRAIQTARFSGNKITNNAQMRPRAVREYFSLSTDEQSLLHTAIDQLHLSARAYNSILKLSHAIADLGGSKYVDTAHLAKAV